MLLIRIIILYILYKALCRSYLVPHYKAILCDCVLRAHLCLAAEVVVVQRFPRLAGVQSHPRQLPPQPSAYPPPLGQSDQHGRISLHCSGNSQVAQTPEKEVRKNTNIVKELQNVYFSFGNWTF